jgi:Arc/MetJ-type ribon-helix-helix transcriptional regulator
MTIDLPEHVERSVHAAVQRGHFASMDDAMTEAAYLLLKKLDQERTVNPPTINEGATAAAHKPVWERILERSAAIPDEEWGKLPTDLAEQHDHYLYGTPKRPTP